MMDEVDEACESLWYAVIRQAVEDARLIPRWEAQMAMYEERQQNADSIEKIRAARNAYSQARAERDVCIKARDWIRKPNAGFTEVCRILNLDPQLVRPMLIEALDPDFELGQNLMRPSGPSTTPEGRKEYATH